MFHSVSVHAVDAAKHCVFSYISDSSVRGMQSEAVSACVLSKKHLRVLKALRMHVHVMQDGNVKLYLCTLCMQSPPMLISPLVNQNLPTSVPIVGIALRFQIPVQVAYNSVPWAV